ncbi:hypothetical protein BH23THE1_BH23THE1_29940 [soil metagenome]
MYADIFWEKNGLKKSLRHSSIEFISKIGKVLIFWDFEKRMFRHNTFSSNGLPLRMGKTSTSRSLLERGSVRMTLLPQSIAKKELSFSPTGYYDENTNIVEVHKYVLENFQTMIKDIPNIVRKIDKLKQRLSTEKLQMIDRNFIQSQIDKLDKEKSSLTNEDKCKDYLERATPILEEFSSLQQEEGPFFRFGEKRKFSPDKLSLIRAFIQIASDYAPLNLTLRPGNRTGLCPYCRQPLSDDEDSKVICYDCGIYQDALTHDAEFSDLARINGANNNNYMNRETFDKCKKCYQGQQAAEFPRELIEKFNDYCKFNHKNMTSLTYETTRPIFKEIGFPGFYEDINLFLFMHEDIHRPLPNISEHEPLIDQDYDQFYQKFIEVKEEERYSGVNAWYLLYILLCRRGVPCDKCDFKMPDTISIRIANDNMARKVFNALGWEFHDTI